MINNVQEKLYTTRYTTVHNSVNSTPEPYQTKSDDDYQVSFGARGNGSNFTKNFKLVTRRLFHYMASPSEMTNAFIAAIGTGIIAPAIILVSPGKGDEKDKEKKHFQALRQPLSAGFALLFQLPMTVLVSRITNRLAYEKNAKFFADEKLGSLIPDKAYLKKQISDIDYAKLEREFDALGPNGEKSALRKELEELIINGHRDVGLETSEAELAKRVKVRKDNFIKGKYAEMKRNEIVSRKVKELLPQNIQINELDLVSESDQMLAIHRNQEAYNKIKQEANLSKFDKILDSLGMSNKKLDALKSKQKTFAKEKGLEILKADHQEVFASQESKLAKYVRVLEENSKKLFNHRKFLITLFFNLFMTTLSCFALNWAHPRLKKWLDSRKNKDDNDNNTPVVGQKVEVRL